MKPLIALTLFLCSFSSLLAQDKECLNFKTGEFRLDDKNIGPTFITRTDSIQIEHLPQHKIKVALNVEWLDACTLKLTLKEIIETKENSYVVRSSSPDADMVLTSEIVKID